MVVKRVQPLSCAKIAGTLYAILGLVFGALFSLAAAAGAFASDSGEGAALRRHLRHRRGRDLAHFLRRAAGL